MSNFIISRPQLYLSSQGVPLILPRLSSFQCIQSLLGKLLCCAVRSISAVVFFFGFGSKWRFFVGPKLKVDGWKISGKKKWEVFGMETMLKLQDHLKFTETTRLWNNGGWKTTWRLPFFGGEGNFSGARCEKLQGGNISKKGSIGFVFPSTTPHNDQSIPPSLLKWSSRKSTLENSFHTLIKTVIQKY